MSKRPSKPIPASIKPAPIPAIAPEDEADHIVIVAKPVRSGGGAIDQVRKHLVSNPEASLDDLKAMLSAAGLKCADGTLKTTRMQTLAILRFIKAKQAGEKTSSLECAADATRYYVVRHPDASVDAIVTWLKSKGCEATPNMVKSSKAATLAVAVLAAA